MWWLERGAALRRLVRPAAALLLASATAGCFQPLYGERSLTGGPGVAAALSHVEVAQISAPPATPLARLAVEVRNELTFGLDRGAGASSPTHRLNINLNTTGSSIIVDPNTARPEFEVISLDAYYTLTEIATGKQVLSASATARVSYDIPGQQQRLAALRGQRDAQSRAARVIASQIRARVAAYLSGAGS
ncbi:MAG TPA: LPS assembly lipoprotein LptE [Xanthobacteraceae bacterium]|nr:LPS assembly lipoprotein LptE [Xanthobacteraceae bacterium]